MKPKVLPIHERWEKDVKNAMNNFYRQRSLQKAGKKINVPPEYWEKKVAELKANEPLTL